MKKYLVLVFIFGFLNGLAQVSSNQEATKDYFYYDHIPKGDTLLTGWKYHAGDDKKWADPSFNDQDWEKGKFDSLDIYDFIKSHPNHLGWFRLRLKVADSLSKKHLMMSFNAVGASEVYLNGHLVKTYGKIDNDPAKVEGVNMLGLPFTINLSEDSIQVLAVRFAYPSPYYHDIWAAFVINATIGGDAAFDTYTTVYRPLYLLITSLFFAGLFFMLSVLHGGFFYFYRRGTQNLYYSIYTLGISLGWLLTIFALLYMPEIEVRNWFNIFHRFNHLFTPVFFLLTIRVFLQYDKKRNLYLLLIISSVAFVIYLVVKNQIVNALYIVGLFYYLEALRITFIKREWNMKGIPMIRLGLISYFVLYFIAVILIFYHRYELGLYFVTASGLVNALMMSWAIARKVGDTNIELQKKLIEVEELSVEKQDILTRQNNELEEKVMERTLQLENSLSNLKSTQSQLIQSEKMASLGELTAGIAHEIQNPLNFVNNFSEVNTELIEELKAESVKPKADRDDQLFDEILNTLKDNEEKINHHGKRADAIVKGMLQHSRSSSGVKEATDINALCDEYLRLSYHGLRAKDKSFNAKFETGFGTSLPKINVVPQDIGRVVLNLINNAFYAVNEKSKLNLSGYEPTVSVSTIYSLSLPTGQAGSGEGRGEVLIKVKDNGNGIPEKVLNKIFQPFFTTKPTGQGTGLGLSLSYDIVKAHGGELKVETKEARPDDPVGRSVGSEFIIQLPYTN